MSRVAYLGVLLADGIGLGMEQHAYGRFLPLAEPMPVGSRIEIDGAPYRVTHVDESGTPGCWLIVEGAPMPIVDEPTTQTPPPTSMQDGAPSAEITQNESGPEGGKKKKRRPNKTILGR